MIKILLMGVIIDRYGTDTFILLSWKNNIGFVFCYLKSLCVSVLGYIS